MERISMSFKRMRSVGQVRRFGNMKITYDVLSQNVKAV
jgi:hypothetical protein